MKTICIYHSRDLDGWMSAAIVKKWNNEDKYCSVCERSVAKDSAGSTECCGGMTVGNSIDFLGWDYGDEIPDLSKYDKVIMCDISFPKEEMFKLFECLDVNFIWIDHHISAMNDNCGKENIAEGSDESTLYNGLRNANFAACELTWEYFFSKQKMPEIVRFLGRYDCFGHKGTDEEQKVLEFQYGARACMTNYETCYEKLVECTRTTESEYWRLQAQVVVGTIAEQGESIYKYLCTEAKQTYSKASPTVFKNHNQISGEPDRYHFLCVNQERFNPINFGIDYHKDGYDGFACFWHANGQWNFSLYNDNGKTDCSVIAKQFGGGGHAGASGFTTYDVNKYIFNN